MQTFLEFIKHNANILLPFGICLLAGLLFILVVAILTKHKKSSKIVETLPISEEKQDGKNEEVVENSPSNIIESTEETTEQKEEIQINNPYLDETVNSLLQSLFDEENEQDEDENEIEFEEIPTDKTFPNLKFADVLKNQEDYQKALAREQNHEGKIYYHTRMNFLSRLSLSSKVLQENYLAIKKYLLSFKNVSARMSIYGETFKISKTKIAKMDIREGNLYLYLATPYQEIKKPRYVTLDVSYKKDHIETPTLTKIRGERKLAYALELLKDEAEKLHLEPKKHPEKTEITLPTYTKEELIKNSSIRIYFAFLEDN